MEPSDQKAASHRLCVGGLPCGNLQAPAAPQGRDEPDPESHWRTGAASGGVQCSCSWLLDRRTRCTGLVTSTHKLRHNQADWTQTEDKKKDRTEFSDEVSHRSKV